MFRLDGNLAVVTGAAGGFGREIVTAFADAGADVVAVDLDLEACQQVLEELRARIAIARVDVRDGASVDQLFQQLGRPPDVLVNAAGIGGRHAAATYPTDLWQEVLAVNLSGTFHCCRAAGAMMLQHGGGTIVNIASTMGMSGFPDSLGYAVSKAGVIQLTKTLAVEWASKNVRVNALAPSTFATPRILDGLASAPRDFDRLLDLTPLNRFGDPHEIVGPALFLASQASSMVTGHVLAVDGGFLAQ